MPTTSVSPSSRNRATSLPRTLNAGVPYDVLSSTRSSASAIFRTSSNVMANVTGRGLLADHNHGEGVRHHRAAAPVATSTCRRRWGRGARSGELGGDQQDVVSLAVQGEGLGADRRNHSLFHDERGRAVFLDHGGVRGSLAENPDALVDRVEQDAVWAA